VKIFHFLAFFIERNPNIFPNILSSFNGNQCWLSVRPEKETDKLFYKSRLQKPKPGSIKNTNHFIFLNQSKHLKVSSVNEKLNSWTLE